MIAAIFFNDLTLELVLRISISLVHVIWNESTTNLHGVKFFLCWMDER